MKRVGCFVTERAAYWIRSEPASYYIGDNDMSYWLAVAGHSEERYPVFNFIMTGFETTVVMKEVDLERFILRLRPSVTVHRQPHRQSMCVEFTAMRE